jgi:SanA protein
MIVSFFADGKIYRDIESLPAREYGLLLGTTPGSSGQTNLFFSTRIEATKELYEKKKIQHILVSGDNSRASYNEPEYMRQALMKAWVPESAITLDYAGYRTLDSIIRAREIFSLSGGFTVISQPFHIERAIFLARANDIDAIGYGAANISLRYGLYTYIREIGARWIAVYDALFETRATVLGEKEVIQK